MRAVVDANVNRNSYFAHPELILLAMLASEDEEERRFAVGIIRDKIRKGEDRGNSLPRQFETPSVNFDAINLQTLINWDTVKLSEPLLTATLSTAEIVACLDSPLHVPSPQA